MNNNIKRTAEEYTKEEHIAAAKNLAKKLKLEEVYTVNYREGVKCAYIDCADEYNNFTIVVDIHPKSFAADGTFKYEKVYFSKYDEQKNTAQFGYQVNAINVTACACTILRNGKQAEKDRDSYEYDKVTRKF